jgi:hypothetical protein
MSNTKIWDALEKTDPAHTKAFQRSGGFKGTAVKPIFCDKRMTELFGACGEGWGITKPEFDVVTAGEELLVYCTVGVWHGKLENVVWGVGGDKVLSKSKDGHRTSDEAYKMAFTDAVGNAYKRLGMSADVHMGRFDDAKYVKELRQEFEPKKEEIPDYAKDAQAILNSARKVAPDEWDGFMDGLGPRLADIQAANEKTFKHVHQQLGAIAAALKVGS